MKKIEKLASKYVYWPEINNPFQNNISFGKNTVADFSKILNPILDAPKISPDKEIIEFYALNQLLSSQRIQEGNVLDDNLVDLYKQYRDKINDLSQKMFVYIFSISLMEVRHSYDLSENKNNLEVFIKEYEEKHGAAPDIKKINAFKDKDFLNTIQKYKASCSEEFYPQFLKAFLFLIDIYDEDTKGDRNKVIKFTSEQLENTDLTIETLLKSISIMFKHNNFISGYGGEAWSDISAHGLNFCQGKMNAEMFIDQAFSLEHNGGSMFNKNFIFNELENIVIPLNNEHINKIRMGKSMFLLNMQHEGQILNYLSLLNTSDSVIDSVISKHIREATNKETRKMQTSISSFYKEMKSHIEVLRDSPIIKNIISHLPKDSIESIDWISFLSYKNSARVNSYLNPRQAHILKKANSIAEKINDLDETEKIKHSKKNVFFEFHDIRHIPEELKNKKVLGGKAYGLNQMQEMDLPVPPAIVWTCENSRAFSLYPDAWNAKLQKSNQEIKSFLLDSHQEEVLCSVRSGAAVSMPGMMDTILNVGMDDKNYSYFCEKLGKSVADECSVNFMKSFVKSSFGIEGRWPRTIAPALKKFKKILAEHDIKMNDSTLFPLDKQTQINLSIAAIFNSWNTDRAKAYREHQKIDHDAGTAVIMQHMVYGNLNSESCTGVLFSRDCINGKPGIIGEFSVQEQGEKVVGGSITPRNLDEMKIWNPEAYQTLLKIAQLIEDKTGKLQDIEFTIENGFIYILQCRAAVCSNMAKTSLLIEQHEKQKISLEQLLAQLEPQSFYGLVHVDTKDPADYMGRCGNPGVISGMVVTNQKTFNQYKEKAKREKTNLILVTPQTKPEHAQLMMECQGFLTQTGGFTSHAAILARSLNKPCLVGSPNVSKIKAGDIITMDCRKQSVWIGQKPITIIKNDEFISKLIKDHKINVEKISTAQEKELKKLNNKGIWMNFGNKTHEVHQSKPFNKFLDMGSLALLKMSQAAKKQNSSGMSKLK